VLGHRHQNAVVTISPVVMSVAQLAEAFAWWSGCNQFDLAEFSCKVNDARSSARAQKVANLSASCAEVVVVDRDCLIP
jgi:hypothetical protein